MERRIINPNPVYPRADSYREVYSENSLVDIERFQNSPVKIALQKDGELTEISRRIYAERLGIGVPPLPNDERVLVSTSEDGAFGFLYARNKDICNLVAAGAVDQAVVGLDRLIEDEDFDKVEVVGEFPDYGKWSVVLASPLQANLGSVEQIKRVATKYPVLTRAYFDSLKCSDVEVITVAGGTEMFPYLEHDDKSIDAIVDLTVSGKSLRQNGLVAWSPIIGEVYPVLIRAKEIPE